jgi:hypothetical protein
MATEGVFPKVDGDVLYASEVNDFASSSHIISIGSKCWITSGVDLQDLGSVVLTYNQISNPAEIEYNLFGKSASDIVGGEITISGIVAYSAQGINSTLADPCANFETNTKYFVGSPYPFYNHSLQTTYSADVTTDEVYFSAPGVLSNNGSIVIKFKGITNYTGSAYFDYRIKINNYY